MVWVCASRVFFLLRSVEFNLACFIFRRVMVLKPRPQTTEKRVREKEKLKHSEHTPYIISNFRVVYSRVDLPSSLLSLIVVASLVFYSFWALLIENKKIPTARRRAYTKPSNHTQTNIHSHKNAVRLETRDTQQASKLHTWPVELIQLPFFLFFFVDIFSVFLLLFSVWVCDVSLALRLVPTSKYCMLLAERAIIEFVSILWYGRRRWYSAVVAAATV